MNDVVAFGNCQADALATMLRAGLPETEYSVEFLSNNPVTGGMQAPETILARIAKADVLLFQPLADRHGKIAEESIRSAVGGRAVSFPYLFNSGMAAMCRAPSGRVHSYGRIFGDEAIIALLDAGAGEADVLAAYERGEIDFGLPERFRHCMAELKEREISTEIRVAGWIDANYRDTQTYLAHNHPTKALLAEVLRQFEDLSGLPIDLDAAGAIEGQPLRGAHRCPISPHDASALGYRFAPSAKWLEQGSDLIRMICADQREVAGAVAG